MKTVELMPLAAGISSFRTYGCSTNIALHNRLAGEGHAFIVASVLREEDAASAAGEVYSRIAETLSDERLVIVHERIFGSLASEAVVLRERQAALSERQIPQMARSPISQAIRPGERVFPASSSMLFHWTMWMRSGRSWTGMSPADADGEGTVRPIFNSRTFRSRREAGLTRYGGSLNALKAFSAGTEHPIRMSPEHGSISPTFWTGTRNSTRRGAKNTGSSASCPAPATEGFCFPRAPASARMRLQARLPPWICWLSWKTAAGQ